MFIGLLLLGAALTACPNNDKYCQKCNGTKCLYCVYSYSGTDGVCVPTDTIPGCYSYKSATECEDCKPGYHQPDAFSCVAFTATFGEKCYLSWSSADVCNVCKNREYWNTTTKQCDTTATCTDANCSYCAENSSGRYCYRCAEGYSLWTTGNVGTASTCLANSVTGCLVTATAGECHTCDFGYYHSGTTCIANTALSLKSSSILKTVLGALFAFQMF